MRPEALFHDNEDRQYDTKASCKLPECLSCNLDILNHIKTDNSSTKPFLFLVQLSLFSARAFPKLHFSPLS